MCGIVAIHSRSAPVDAKALRSATAALRHRGPDGERCWISPSGMVGLGHTRLAIIDPAAAQPLSNEDEQLHLVVNGEFYGYETILAELRDRGHHLRTRSDSEIALHLYEELGTRCLERLRGQFAFALWDARHGTLFAARDRFGIKPLFYAQFGDVLSIASEAKALFAAGLDAAWDHAGVYHAIHACPDENRSLFTNVQQLPPGHFLISSPQGVRVERYWDIGPAGTSHRGRDTAADMAGDVRDVLTESVRLRLRADVPVGCLLSGGLDSSAVLGIASTISESPVAAFTVGFEHPDYDEREAAVRMARHAHANHHIVPVGDAEMADHFSDAVWHAENVQYNSHGTARYLLSRAVRQAGYKSVMAGEGADEVFYGYEFTRATARVSAGGSPLGWLKVLPRLLRSPRRRFPGLAATSPWLARLATLLDVPTALLGRLTDGTDLLRSLLAPDFLTQFAGYDVYRSYYKRCDANAQLRTRPPAERLTYLWLHSLFVNYHLAADRLDMAHGVEVRFPFLDHVLFEAVNRIPVAVRAGSEQEKRLLRDAARPFIPDEVYTRRKKPFWAPPRAADPSNSLGQFVQDTLRGQALSRLPFFDRSAVLNMLDTLGAVDPSRARGTDSLLLLLSSLCVLGERCRI